VAFTPFISNAGPNLAIAVFTAAGRGRGRWPPLAPGWPGMRCGPSAATGASCSSCSAARQPRAAAQPAGDALAHLTGRERDVLRQVAAGQSNTETAAALSRSAATVKTPASRLLDKLGCRDRAQLVVAAYEAGIAVPGQR
jgi:DNA-binding CsgD family transcriptional regulator